jgi:DNA modification methylase
MGPRKHSDFEEKMNLPKISSLGWGEEISFPSSKKGDMYSHVVGARYPCRSVAYVPRLILNELATTDPHEVNVLDPFMGSGTTALEANLCSFNAYGLEVDPYARLIGSASVQRITKTDLAKLQKFEIELEAKFRNTRSLKSLVPDILNIDHWFPEKNIDDLARLKRVIAEFVETAPKVNNFLYAAYADIIRAVSYAERQSLKPYVSSRFKKQPAEVLPSFQKCLKKYLEGAQAVAQLQAYGTGKINWLEGDATQFNLDNQIDVAITSPPYINAMDYVRCIKLESSWVGTGSTDIFSEVRSSQVGEAARGKKRVISPEVLEIIGADFQKIQEVDKARSRTLAAYFEDMKDNLSCVFTALKSNGQYHIIVGDSVVRGVDVATHRHIGKIAEKVGFEWSGYFKYQIKDHRTSLPRNGRGGKIDLEHVVSLKKP